MGLRMKSDKIRQFTIDVASEVLSDLRQRLKKTRSSYQIAGTNWDAGTDGDYLKELIDYWRDTYDWRKHETALNKFTHFKTEVDDIDIHFIHERGKGANPFPLILTHGYPDSFYRFAKIIPMLTDPKSFGGRTDDAFDVVVPDLPGYGFSDKPKKARSHLSRQRSVGTINDGSTRIRAIWSAWWRLGQYSHGTTRAQPPRRRRCHSSHRCTLRSSI